MVRVDYPEGYSYLACRVIRGINSTNGVQETGVTSPPDVWNWF